MDGSVIHRVWTDIIGRFAAGPLHFRIIMQPAMALFFGIRDGIHDAKRGAPAYFWSLFSQPKEAAMQLKNGFHSVMRVFLLAIIMDAIYQLIVMHRFYPGEAILVALLLAFVPYLLIRGPANRLGRLKAKSHIGHNSEKAGLQ